MSTIEQIAREGLGLSEACERAFYESGDGSREWLTALSAFEGHANVTNHAMLCRAVLARGEAMKLARAVLKAADRDVGIARLSDDELSWICPRCESRGKCKPDCTRDALLSALDNLTAALAQEGV